MSDEVAGRVGFVGLGRMGGPMVANLVAAGRDVIAYDADPAALARLTPGRTLRIAARLGDVAVTPVVILMLPDSDAVEAVVDGLAAALAPGCTVIDMGSSEPARTRALAGRLAAVGHRFIDAPVSGGVSGAQRATLTIMVGATDDDFGLVRDLLGVIGERVIHAGPTGAGHAVKALNNVMSATHLLATCEALRAAAMFGLDVDVVLDIVNRSTGRSASSEVKWPTFIGSGSFDSGFGLDLMVKDMRIALGLARDVGSPSPLIDAATELWSAAASELPAGVDHTEIARWLDG